MADNNKYAIAFDLGSTTIDASLIEITKKETILTKSISNRQSLYGSDVINRILATIRDSSKLKIMKSLVVEDMLKLIEAFINEAKLIYEDICRIVIAGNTTMISILCEYSLNSLGEYPFEVPFSKSIVIDFAKLFEKNTINCPVYLTGNAGAFIGGDILAGILYIEKKHQTSNKDNWMLIDLGTNGEMVICSKGKYYATSVACGPAFEGCVRKQNAYANTVLSAICLGLKTKNIDRYGALKSPYDTKGLNVNNITISQEIVHQIMLAKAAIRTGIDFLISHASLSYEDIDSVYIAGGFGFHMVIEDAIFLKLLPGQLKERFVSLGNTSLEGAKIISQSDNNINLIDDYTKGKIDILMLANEPSYQEKLISNMTF